MPGWVCCSLILPAMAARLCRAPTLSRRRPDLLLQTEIASLAGNWPALAAAMAASGSAKAGLLVPAVPGVSALPGGAPGRVASAPVLLGASTMQAATAAAAAAAAAVAAAAAAAAGAAASSGGQEAPAKAPAAVPAPAGDAAEAAEPEGGVLASLPDVKEERMDLAQVLGVHSKTPLSSPLLQGLMSPAALGQLFENWP